MNNIDIFEESLLSEGLDVVTEKYVGKSKGLEKIEKQVGKAREKYKGTKVAAGIYNDKEFVTLGNMLADEFNFKVIDFNLVNDPNPNAMTITVGSSYDANIKYYDKANITSGHRFKHKYLSTIIRVTTGLWSNPEFTDAEVTAIILHEIGHSFQHTVNDGLRMYSSTIFFINLYSTIIQAITISGIPAAAVNLAANDSSVRSSVNNLIKKSTSLSKIANTGSAFLWTVRKIITEVLTFIDKGTLGMAAGLSGIAGMLLNNPFNTIISILTAPIGKGAEYVSDNFAAENGYGPELISALNKIDLDPKTSGSSIDAISKKLPLFDSICTLNSLPSALIMSLIGSHPISAKRAVNVVRDLESEMKKSDVSPAMKKEIQKQIDEIKESVDNYTKVESMAEGMALRKSIFKLFVDYDKDPKGGLVKLFTNKNLNEEAIEDIEMEFMYECIDI